MKTQLLETWNRLKPKLVKQKQQLSAWQTKYDLEVKTKKEVVEELQKEKSWWDKWIEDSSSYNGPIGGANLVPTVQLFTGSDKNQTTEPLVIGFNLRLLEKDQKNPKKSERLQLQNEEERPFRDMVKEFKTRVYQHYLNKVS